MISAAEKIEPDVGNLSEEHKTLLASEFLYRVSKWKKKSAALLEEDLGASVPTINVEQINKIMESEDEKVSKMITLTLLSERIVESPFPLLSRFHSYEDIEPRTWCMLVTLQSFGA